jgi:hypothetical protein
VLVPFCKHIVAQIAALVMDGVRCAVEAASCQDAWFMYTASSAFSSRHAKAPGGHPVEGVSDGTLLRPCLPPDPVSRLLQPTGMLSAAVRVTPFKGACALLNDKATQQCCLTAMVAAVAALLERVMLLRTSTLVVVAVPQRPAAGNHLLALLPCLSFTGEEPCTKRLHSSHYSSAIEVPASH